MVSHITHVVSHITHVASHITHVSSDVETDIPQYSHTHSPNPHLPSPSLPLSSSQRKGNVQLKERLQNVLVPMFCHAATTAPEDKKAKLEKVS